MHIQLSERRKIERALKNNTSLRRIAKRLGRSVSTISHEIQSNSVKGHYSADQADRKARVRRENAKQQCLKVAMNKDLKAYVTNHVHSDQNPEALAVRLKYVDTHIQYASHKAIYAFIHSVHGCQLEHHLYYQRVHKKGGPKRHSVRQTDVTKKHVSKRSKKANNRTEFGHFEGDFIESGKGGTGCLLVLVERKTRYLFVVYIEDRSTFTINQLIATTLKDVPVLSITLDNDISFQKHEALSDMIDAVVYFTTPYTSQEKGTVENRNKAIREFVPKRSDVSQYQSQAKLAETRLRNRFMVVLKGHSPQEVWDKEMCARVLKNPLPSGQKIMRKSVRFEG